MCTDFCTTVVFTDFTIFFLILFEFPAVFVCSCCDKVTVASKRFRTVAADSGFSSFLMLKSTANFNLKKTSPLSLYPLLFYRDQIFFYNKDAKNTWLACQCYSFEENPATLATKEIDRRKELVKKSAECAFYGKSCR